MSGETHDPELGALESALAALAPAAGRLDRDQVLFRAGQASVPRRGWAWPCATAAVAALTTLAVTLALRPQPPPIERIVYVSLPQPPVNPAASVVPAPAPFDAGTSVAATEEQPSGQADYLKLRDQVLRLGADALPGLPREGPPASDKLLGLPLDSEERPGLFHPKID